MISVVNCYPMQNYTNFLIQVLQLYLIFVKLRLYLIIYISFACDNSLCIRVLFKPQLKRKRGSSDISSDCRL